MAFGQDTQQIVKLAWPVLVGQLAVLAFGTIDTVLLGRLGSVDLAALAVGSAAYITVFVGLMGVLLAIGPIVGHLYGAGRLAEAGQQFHQGVWLALALSVLGIVVLAFPQPFLALAKVEGEVERGIRGYMGALAFALPAALLFTVYRGFNTAISRPKAVMNLQLGALALKLPLSVALAWGVPALGWPALGVVGCGLATVIVMWLQCAAAAWILVRDPHYAPYALVGRGLDAPNGAMLRAQLRLGLPMGAGILIEVTGFTFMAIFIARLGPLPVAGHQIAANLVAMLFMMPLALANATSTLVAQRLGAQALQQARHLAWHGVLLASMLAVLMGALVYAGRTAVAGLYTQDAAVAAAALVLMAWVVWFHLADALQTMAALVLRAYRVATLPVVVYAVALWGVGLGGGYALAFREVTPASWLPWAVGASGFWASATIALWLAAVLLLLLLAWVMNQKRREESAPASAPSG
ncbi:MAG: MATE family efflux transporter [Betaproteobacteria bacterium]|nr:MATE family efflux transporter [Betaproteobacteria bacterium]